MERKRLLFVNEGRLSYIDELLSLIKKRLEVENVFDLKCLELDLVDRNRNFDVDIRSVFGGVFEKQKDNYGIFLAFHGRGYKGEQPYFMYCSDMSVFRVCYGRKSIDPVKHLDDLKKEIDDGTNKVELIPKEYSKGISDDIGSGYDEEARLSKSEKALIEDLPEKYSCGVYIDIPYGEYNSCEKAYQEEISLRKVLDLLIDYSIK